MHLYPAAIASISPGSEAPGALRALSTCGHAGSTATLTVNVRGAGPTLADAGVPVIVTGTG